MQVCLVQAPPVFFNLKQSVALARQMIAQHGEAGAELLVFPETWLCGYPVWLDCAPDVARWDHPGARGLFRILSENAVTLPGEAMAALSAAAQLSGVTVVIGAHERIGKTLYNTQFFITADGTVTPHRKLVPTYTERLVWGRGDGSTLKAVNTPFGVLGGLICWEHWMPLARAAMQSQGEVVHVAQWPEVSEMHQVASRNYAFEGGCFVLASGGYFTKSDILAGFDSLAGHDDAARELLEAMEDNDRPLKRGLSAVYAPNGRVLAQAEEGPEALVVDLDLSLVSEAPLTLDTNGHYARPDVFQLKVDTRPHTGVIFEANKGALE